MWNPWHEKGYKESCHWRRVVKQRWKKLTFCDSAAVPAYRGSVNLKKPANEKVQAKQGVLTLQDGWRAMQGQGSRSLGSAGVSATMLPLVVPISKVNTKVTGSEALEWDICEPLLTFCSFVTMAILHTRHFICIQKQINKDVF